MAEWESAQAERERQDAERVADIQKRQVRLGHVPAPTENDEEEKSKPKAKSGTRKKNSE